MVYCVIHNTYYIMIKSVTGPVVSDGGPSASARTEEARRAWPQSAAATPLNSDPSPRLSGSPGPRPAASAPPRRWSRKQVCHSIICGPGTVFSIDSCHGVRLSWPGPPARPSLPLNSSLVCFQIISLNTLARNMSRREKVKIPLPDWWIWIRNLDA